MAQKEIKILPKEPTKAQQDAIVAAQEKQRKEQQQQQEKNRRFQLFCNDWFATTTYEFSPDEHFCQTLTASFEHFSAVQLKIPETVYRDIVTRTVWSYGHFNIIIQVMSTVNAYQLGFTMHEYMAYKTMLTVVADDFNAALMAAEKELRGKFDEHEAIIEKEETTPISTVAGEA